MPSDALDRVLSSLRRVKQTPRGWDALCPVHEADGDERDHTPSLGIAVGKDGHVLLKCMKGCNVDDLCAAMGMKVADLMPRKDHHRGNGHAPRADGSETRGNFTETARWVIRDPEGAYVVEHVRADAPDGRKKFSWKRGETWNLRCPRHQSVATVGGCPDCLGVDDIPLYRIEEIAVSPADPVLVTEGEKAADALARRGYVAVGTTTGADEKGKRPGDRALRALAGRKVILWPDNDDVGRAHMKAIGDALVAQGITDDVRVLTWPEAPRKGDAADFDRSDEDLRFLVETAEPVERPPSARWRTLEQVAIDAKAAPREFVSAALGLATRTVAFIGGEPKAGKSELVAAFVAAVTTGGEFLSGQCAASDVVLVTEEGDHDIEEKMRRYGAHPKRVHVLSRDVVGAPPTWDETIRSAVAKCLQTTASTLVIDTLSFWAGLLGDDERSEGVMRERLIALQHARDAGLATVVIHHSVKAKDVEGIAALRGSGAIAGAVESVVIYRRVNNDPLSPRRKLELWSRLGPGLMLVERVLPTDGGEPHFRHVEDDDKKAAGDGASDPKLVSAVAKVGGWLSKKQIREATGISDRTLEGRLPKLAEGGKLLRRGTGAKKDPFLYAMPGTPA